MQQSIYQIPDESSILYHNVPHLPIAISTVHLSDYTNMDIIHHWNDDFTIIAVKKGRPVLQISKKDIYLQPGDCVLINIHRKHRIYSPNHEEASFACILASPQLILANFPKFLSVTDLTEPEYPAYHLLPVGTEDNNITSNLINQVMLLYQKQPQQSSLRILGYLHLILAQFMLSIYQKSEKFPAKPDPDYQAFQKMKNFIKENYRRKIFLKEIASSGGVCRSRCCSIFQKYLHQRPIEYLNAYRLSISRRYLVDRSTTIASVANICGFTDQSYYTKLFVQKYGYTPYEYRNRILAASTLPAMGSSESPIY